MAPATAPVADAGCSVSIYRIYYDSPGSDTGSNSSLNAEWIQLRNGCTTGKVLTNWTIKDASVHKYTFGSYTLGASKMVKLHTGRGSNTSTDRYWGSAVYIWNNTGDTAKLRNAAGTLIDKCGYSGGGASVDC